MKYVGPYYDWIRDHRCRGCYYYRRCGSIRTFFCRVFRAIKGKLMKIRMDK